MYISESMAKLHQIEHRNSLLSESIITDQNETAAGDGQMDAQNSSHIDDNNPLGEEEDNEGVMKK